MNSLTAAVLISMFLLPGWLTPSPRAESLPPEERQKIETLIKQVDELKDVKFIRNGSSYNASQAATFLRRKWQANDSNVKTARDFIERVASFSGTSRKPYLIRFKDGEEIKSREYLLAELRKIESPAPKERAGGG